MDTSQPQTPANPPAHVNQLSGTMHTSPPWFHRKGRTIRLVDQHCPTRFMMENNHAILVITVANDCNWTVDWTIRPTTGGYFRGQLTFDAALFSRAFLLEDDAKDRRADATAYQPGKLIRYGRYLSIPGPGSGEDSDPNCSVFIDELMELALREFFKRTCPCKLA